MLFPAWRAACQRHTVPAVYRRTINQPERSALCRPRAGWYVCPLWSYARCVRGHLVHPLCRRVKNLPGMMCTLLSALVVRISSLELCTVCPRHLLCRRVKTCRNDVRSVVRAGGTHVVSGSCVQRVDGIRCHLLCHRAINAAGTVCILLSVSTVREPVREKPRIFL